LDKSFRRSKMV